MKHTKFKPGDRVTPICSFDGPRTEVQLDENHKMPARYMDKIGKHATVISRDENNQNTYMILFDGEKTECGWWHGEYLKKVN